MARNASVMKQGYYPAPPEAIAGILRHLKIPAPPPDSKFAREDVNILDPCAGEAKALVQIAEGLGVSWGHVFAIELNASRSARIAEAYPNIRLLGPCSFEATRITRHFLSLVYLILHSMVGSTAVAGRGVTTRVNGKLSQSGRARQLLIRIEYSIQRWLMSHGVWRPSYRQRTLSILMVTLASTGHRRWLSRPWQWSLRDYMVVVAFCSAGLLVSRCPMPMIVFFTTLAGAVLACLILARHGFQLADITMLLVIILLTAAVILPAMERTRNRTLGKSFFPFAVPAKYITLFSGSE
jgi:hypothetical protein